MLDVIVTAMGTKTLKLDSSFRPIEVVDSLEALVLCLLGKASAIENYAKKVHSPSSSFYLPAVIVLKRYVKYQFTKLTPNRTNVLWRDKLQCQYCVKTFNSEELTLDHVIPKSRGGENTWENLVTACKRCNQKKGARFLHETGMRLCRAPVRPKNSALRTLKKEQIDDIWKDYLWDLK
jgi:5-methylcytosine-specific restriction endonuclease McrA